MLSNLIQFRLKYVSFVLWLRIKILTFYGQFRISSTDSSQEEKKKEDTNRPSQYDDNVGIGGSQGGGDHGH